MPVPNEAAPAVLDPFADPIRNGLQTLHAALAERNGLALKYPEDVAPFAAVEELSAAAAHHLHDLLAPGETAWLFHELPPLPAGLELEATLTCLQMVFPAAADLPIVPGVAEIVPLSCGHAEEMVALTDIAFPGFFRARTCVMGDYFGIRDAAGRLVSLGGERQRMLAADRTPWIEVSAICTHPEERGKGYAAQMLAHLLRLHRGMGAVSALHVAATNSKAIALYRRLGFETLRSVEVLRVRRKV